MQPNTSQPVLTRRDINLHHPWQIMASARGKLPHSVKTLGSVLSCALLLSLFAGPSFAQKGSSGVSGVIGADASDVQMVNVKTSHCNTVDGTNYTGSEYFANASDVARKVGVQIQTKKEYTCCSAAKPWNGFMCEDPVVCAAGTESVGGTCVATANSCATIGRTLIGGVCGIASPPPQPECPISESTIGRVSRPYYSVFFSPNYGKTTITPVRHNGVLLARYDTQYGKMGNAALIPNGSIPSTVIYTLILADCSVARGVYDMATDVYSAYVGEAPSIKITDSGLFATSNNFLGTYYPVGGNSITWVVNGTVPWSSTDPWASLNFKN